jgi:hypothetical protein
MFTWLFRRTKRSVQNDGEPCLRKARSPGRKTDPFRFVPRLEALEERLVPSTYTVTKTADDNSVGTLRWAIGQADTFPNSSTINFKIGSGLQTIILSHDEPVLKLSHDNIFLDGTPPVVYPDQQILISGANSGNPDGLDVTANNCTVGGQDLYTGGISFVLFSGAGIKVTGTNDVIQNDYLGTDFATEPNQGNGIGLLFSHSSNSMESNCTIFNNTTTGMSFDHDSGDQAAEAVLKGNTQGVAVNQATNDSIDVDCEHSVNDGIVVSQSSGIWIGPYSSQVRSREKIT